MDATLGRTASLAGGFVAGRIMHGKTLGPVPLAFAIGGAATLAELAGIGDKSVPMRAAFDMAHGAAAGEAAIQGLLMAGATAEQGI